PRRRRRHVHAAAGPALGHRRSHPAGRGTRRLTGPPKTAGLYRTSQAPAAFCRFLHTISTLPPQEYPMRVGSLTSSAPTGAGTARGPEWTGAYATSRPRAGRDGAG